MTWLCIPCGREHGTRDTDITLTTGRCALCGMVTRVARADKFGYKQPEISNQTILDIGADNDYSRHMEAQQRPSRLGEPGKIGETS